MTPEIGSVLALRTEKVDKKAPFDTFRGKKSDYIVKEFSNAKDVMDIVKTMNDPNIKFNQKNKP